MSATSAITLDHRIDPHVVREQFSSLQSGVAHFDAPGGTQTPDAVADGIYQSPIAVAIPKPSATPTTSFDGAGRRSVTCSVSSPTR